MTRAESSHVNWRRRLEPALLILIHLMVWGYVAQILLRPEDGWAFYFSFLSMLMLPLAMIWLKGWYRLISAVFLLAGFLLLWQGQIPFSDVWRFFGSTTSILSLLILAPFFSIPITLGAYHRSALLIVRGRVRKPQSTYFVLSALTYMLATLMNVAAIVASYTTLNHLTRSFPKDVSEKINDAAYCRGHSLAMIWSPVGATLGVALARVPADPGTVIAAGLIFSVAMLFLDAWVMKRRIRGNDIDAKPFSTPQTKIPISVGHWRKMGVFCGVIVIFVVGVIALHEMLSMPVIDAVILLILFLSLFWALCLRKPERLKQELWDKGSRGNLRLLPQMMLFISVGFFTQALAASGLLDPLAEVVAHWSATFGWLLILLVVFLATVASQIGLFPVLIVMLLADLVPYQAMHLRPEWFAFAIAAGSVGGVSASPLTLNVNLVATLMQRDPRLVARVNWPFAVVMFLAVGMVTVILSLLFPA